MNVRIGAAILCALMILEAFPLVELFSQTVLTRGGKPVLIPEGPYGAAATSTPVDHYWFQTGAMGYSSGLSASSDYTAANVTIRTVFDKVYNDAHSYWVGGYISNGAFIQVGYLNEVSTTDQPYCCAWFYEYFPANNSTCCDPVIGLEGSAGPIGSWHTYTMAHTGNGVWSFYMDGRQLGSSPDLGATNSGIGWNLPILWETTRKFESATRPATKSLLGRRGRGPRQRLPSRQLLTAAPEHNTVPVSRRTIMANEYPALHD
ncbi:hypothetical protein E6H36_09980 [Candidatus Bathyarchaeota archaeon]|nr:MAG: hypothetical protein E6H36_09980 [Candidatus Bathyarchaeota archaeon]